MPAGLFNLSVMTAGTGSGVATSPSGGTYTSGTTISTNAIADPGSTFGSWSCVGTTSYLSTSNATGGSFSMPSENVTCTATFNLGAPPPVSAPVDSGLALSLTFLGIAAMVGFKKWRNRNAGH
ncbi:MAG: hypothetical protein PHP00_02015 [Thiotrichaceae bacterium]|nr:hypothetical protein [Thiotrichaceae bacterium]